MKKFMVGDYIICNITGISGICIRFFQPTAQQEQAMVLTIDGRLYHAPVSEWSLINCGVSGFNYDVVIKATEDHIRSVLNAYGEYLVTFGYWYMKGEQFSVKKEIGEPYATRIRYALGNAYHDAYCPRCNAFLYPEPMIEEQKNQYCKYCGQKIEFEKGDKND